MASRTVKTGAQAAARSRGGKGKAGRGKRTGGAEGPGGEAVEGLGAQKVEWLLTGTLKPYPENVKLHPPEQVRGIAASIRQWGFNNPILADEGLEILAGHGRWLAARDDLGMERVPVIVLTHLTPAQKRAYRLADNQLPLLGSFDMAALHRQIMQVQDEDGVDPEAMGFTADAMKGIEAALRTANGGFLGDLLPGDAPHDGNDGMKPPARGVAIKFDMLPADRDTVVTWLSQERDRRKLRTSAEALVALAKEGRK
jgi:hypothetical protein